MSVKVASLSSKNEGTSHSEEEDIGAVVNGERRAGQFDEVEWAPAFLRAERFVGLRKSLF